MPSDDSQTTRATAEIHVTKLTAARRQLCAAIRMFFAREDELAVHTVASAAYRVLSDLKAARGRDEAGDHYLTPIFYAVRDYHRGTLPSYLADDPEAMRWIREMAAKMPITADSEFNDIVASASSQVAAAFWQDRNRIANFLKHADRDLRAHISLNDVDNLDLLLYGLAAYVDLTSDHIQPEGTVLWIYANAVRGTKESMPERMRKIAADLEEIAAEEQVDFCAALLREMKND